MNGYKKWIFATIVFNLLMSSARAEDIDLFASGLASGAAAASVPNVVFVLDNTAAWNSNSNLWVDPETGDSIKQGLAELNAIHNILEDLHGEEKNINVAVLAFDTGQQSEGGFVRLHMSSLLDDWTSIDATLVAMKDEFAANALNAGSSRSYGYLANDVYSYLAGLEQSFAGVGTEELADEDGYQQPYSVFRSPLTESDICSETYLIWVSNPSGPPNADAPANSEVLTALYAELGESVAYALAGNGVTGGGMDMRAYDVPDAQPIGSSAQCYISADACTEAIEASSPLETAIVEACSEYSSCYCDGNASNCAQGAKKYNVWTGGDRYIPSGGDPEPGHDYNLDDWTKFLHEIGVPLEVAGEDGAPDTVVRIPVTTYTLDVYQKATSSAQSKHSSLMDSAAEVGGGTRQEVTNTSEMELALGRIFGDIIDINTSFAAVTLPLSATNRAQAENKVFVGMFRPAAQRKPRWLGNLKQYQLAVFDGRVELADVSLNRAINPQTGFAQSCATSFWTTDTSDEPKNAEGVTGPYFEGLGMEPSPTSECLADFRGERSVLSDEPDGPFVEKGGVAQQIRGQEERLILTQTGGGALRDIDPADFGESASASPVFDYLAGTVAGLKGGDLYEQNADGDYVDNPRLADAEVMPFQGRRPTIHGDIVHSRPLTVTYGPNANGGSNFRVFYGANDGVYRSVNPDDGSEDWAFVASEHWGGISRLYANTPTVDFYGLDASQSTDIGAQPKRYFFDGSTGVFARYDAEDRLLQGYIYPTMRRGGRMVYALNVSPNSGSAGVPPAQPEFMWKVGCDEAGSCTDSELSEIGQTWSTPVTGLVKGYEGDGSAEEPNPVLLMGGGWDDCLDEDTATLSVGSCSTGNFIYVLNGKTGALLRKFETEAPVVAEIELLDIDYDGYFDFAYAADASGNLYRVTFSKITEGVLDPSLTLDPIDWRMDLVAYSNRQGVRFMNQPISAEVGNAVFIAIGSGDRERPLKQNYPYAENVENRFYVFIDRPFLSEASAVDLDSMLNAETGLSSEPDESGAVETILDYDGWYLDLPDQGEQIVNQAAIGSGYVFFNSFQAEGSTQGFCSDLGTAKAYRVPLFAPEAVEGEEFGEGVPIPPIIVTVKLNNGQDACGENCGPGEITDDVVTVIIGLEGFEVVDITPTPPSKVREAFRVENMDRL